ncbi:hypothetical protein [Komagataeibacter saccharivorans]|uniref:hypothetical protein n=1 Tax=Komagataeibacter saccharivorans TaxID=265959 RepID=UPI0024A9D3E4|nr:hypothetical protein [Komagataeibacter saccharivorans]
MVYRIDDTTAVSTLPALPTDNIGDPGFFTGGSTGGQAATRVRFWWLNMVQEELATIVLAAGLVLNKSNNGQVLAAIQKLISDAVTDLDTALSAMIDNCVAGNWALGTTGYQVVGMNCQISDLRPAFFYVDGNKTQQAGGRLGLYADVTALQTTLTAEQATRADQVATLTANVSTCVSGIYGKSSGDYQMLGFYQQVSTGRPIAVFNNGTATVYNGIANYTDVTTLQTNLTSFQAQQANQNTTFASDIAARIPTNAINDGTNAPITLMNFYLQTGMLWFSADGIQSNVAQTNPGDGWNAIKNITVENDNGALTVLDTTGKTNTYQPCSADIQSDTVSVTKVGDLVIQTFEASISNANNGGAGSVTVNLPQALTKSIQFAKGNALGGTQGGTMWIPSVNVLPTSLTQVTIYADNLQDENWTAAVTVQVLVIGS